MLERVRRIGPSRGPNQTVRRRAEDRSSHNPRLKQLGPIPRHLQAHRVTISRSQALHLLLNRSTAYTLHQTRFGMLDAAHQQLGGNIVLIRDNDTAHCDTARKRLIATRAWLTVFCLPPYARQP
jgi:hypothetical protein